MIRRNWKIWNYIIYTQSHTCFGMERKHPEIHLLNLRKMAAHSSPHVNMSCLCRTCLKGMLFQWWLRRHRNTTYQRYQELAKSIFNKLILANWHPKDKLHPFANSRSMSHEHHHHNIVRQPWASDPMMMSTGQAAQTAGKLPVHQSFMVSLWVTNRGKPHFLSPLGKTPGRRAPPLVGRPAWGPRIEDKHLHQW